MPSLLTVKEAAQVARVGTRTVYRWIDRGILPAVRLPGGDFRIRRDDLDRLLEPVRAEG